MTAEVLDAWNVFAVFQQGGQRGRKHPPEWGGPPRKGHHVLVKATEGEISSSLSASVFHPKCHFPQSY